MSGGMKITEHQFFAGKGSPRFPDGPHKTKNYSSAEGAGTENDYEDTTEKIKEQQMLGKKQVNNRPQKPLHRY